MFFFKKQDKIQNIDRTIITKNLNKQLIFYRNTKDFIEKLATFKRKKCNKYFNLTKEFLIDPAFLKFAEFLLKKSSNGVHINLEKANNKIFTEIANTLTIGTYTVGSFKQVETIEFGMGGIKKTNNIILHRKDQIVQHGISILLAMIYEKNQLLGFN